jgi:hypothetical protein
MTNWRIASCAVLLLAGAVLAGAEKFQVSFLTGPSEPRIRKPVHLQGVAEVFAKRLSKTLKQKINVVPFEKADAETIFLITREDALDGKYSKALAGLPLDSFIVRYPVTVKGKKMYAFSWDVTPGPILIPATGFCGSIWGWTSFSPENPAP